MKNNGKYVRFTEKNREIMEPLDKLESMRRDIQTRLEEVLLKESDQHFITFGTDNWRTFNPETMALGL